MKANFMHDSVESENNTYIYKKVYTMSNNEKENNGFEVITYTETVGFNYTLPNEDEEKTIEHDLTIVWEDTLEKFFEEHGKDKPHKIHSFKREREQKNLIEQIESEAENLIDEVQETIANKMKFGFDFSGQLHNDD